jgi:capsular exopolysaccharide synthesis family protein
VAQDAGIGLPDVLEAVRRQWKLALVLFLALVAGAVFYAERLPAEYTSKAVIALTPRPAGGANAADVTELGQQYVAYLTAETTVDEAARTIGLPDPHGLRGRVSAKVATESVNLTVSVDLRSAQRAADAANALADAAEVFAVTDKLLTADVVAPATTPSAPSKPRRHLLEAAGAAVALLIAIFIAVLVERGRPRVRGAREVGFVTGHAVIGRIPKSRAIRGGLDRALADPIVGGAVRSLRTVLDLEARATPVRTLVVTSSVPGEGKSTIAAMLASAIARLDARVLLVDADLRRPTVATHFGIEPVPGVAGLLNGTTSFDAAVRRIDRIPGLGVLPTAAVPDAGDLVARNLNSVLQRARGEYDVVVVDSPPLLAGDDAGTIAALGDAVLMVVASGVDSRRLGEASRSLEALGVRVVGVVLNRAHVATFAYGYGLTGSRDASPTSLG